MVAGVTLPHERGFTDLATVLSQVDAHIAMRDAADRARVEREAEAWRTAEARSRRWYMRITNALLPQGSKFRRALAAAFRELRR